MNRHRADDTVEAILNDLYASEINCDIRPLEGADRSAGNAGPAGRGQRRGRAL